MMKVTNFIATFALLWVPTATISFPAAYKKPFVLTHTFDDPTVTSGDRFGFASAIDGNHVLIGAYQDDTHGENVGQAHLFDTVTGNIVQTFDDPTMTDGDQFGRSVSIDGVRALIGAPFDDTNGSNVGQVHLFDVRTGTLLQTFNDPAMAASAHFGWSVAIDEDIVVIGAPSELDDSPSENVGQVYLFDVDTGSLIATFSDPTVTGYDQFGHSVAIDGDHVVIGAPYDDTQNRDVGQAHLFDVVTGALLHTLDDPTVTSSNQFGFSVDVDANHVLIGAFGDISTIHQEGQAHLFDATTGNLLHSFSDPTVTYRDGFGLSVAIDGKQILVGAARDKTHGDEVGQAHLFYLVPEPHTLHLLAVAFLSLISARVLPLK